MQLSKRKTYFVFLAAVVVICLLYQSIWIFSRTTRAEYLDHGIDKRGAYWMIASYQVNYNSYRGYFLQEGFNPDKRFFDIRYLIFAPDLARSNTFVSNWGTLILIFIFTGLVLAITFVRTDIISNEAVFLFQKTRPFISIIHNEIKDYDEHDIENTSLNDAQKVLRDKLLEQKIVNISEKVYASVYKYNPNAIVIIVIYVFYLFWYLFQMLSLSMGYGGLIFFGAIAVSVPPYIQMTDNPVFKMKIPDEGRLIFSLSGVEDKEYIYPLSDIESAVIYLESFRGFKYLDRTTTGMSTTVCVGDNNKISFRSDGEVYDYTFILNEAADYWSFKNLMASWSVKGVSVVLQKIFEDEFIIQEMIRYNEG